MGRKLMVESNVRKGKMAYRRVGKGKVVKTND